MIKSDYTVQQIKAKDTYPFLLEIHYAKRIPSISFAFGLFKLNALVGVITYGTPPSSPLRKTLKLKYKTTHILELNRLCLKYNLKNEASFLISKSLKLLPKDTCIVSFADISQGHLGTVYKASNFKYEGLSAKRTDWKIKGLEHKHGISVADEFRGKPNRVSLMKEKYKDRFYLQERSRKHKFIYLI